MVQLGWVRQHGTRLTLSAISRRPTGLAPKMRRYICSSFEANQAPVTRVGVTKVLETVRKYLNGRAKYWKSRRGPEIEEIVAALGKAPAGCARGPGTTAQAIRRASPTGKAVYPCSFSLGLAVSPSRSAGLRAASSASVPSCYPRTDARACRRQQFAPLPD